MGSVEGSYVGDFRLTDAVLYIATLIRAHLVIPAKAGIQKKTGFRVKPGMTDFIRLMSPCIDFFVLN